MSTEIATSIAPGKTAVQQYCVSTWAYRGFKVTSLNNAKEIDSLRRYFPSVNFVQVDADPLVRLHSIFDYFKAINSRLVGIVNSDVALDHPRLPAYVESFAEESLIFGNRQDVAVLGDRTGSPMVSGFDFFFFGAKWLNKFSPASYVLGQPAWDYWVPLTLKEKARIELRYLVTPVAYHLRHRQNWNAASYVKYSSELQSEFPFPGKATNGTFQKFARDYIYSKSIPSLVE